MLTVAVDEFVATGGMDFSRQSCRSATTASTAIRDARRNAAQLATAGWRQSVDRPRVTFPAAAGALFVFWLERRF
jgi:hypothetical protein